MAESIADLNIALRATGEKLAADINAGISRAQNQVGVKAIALGNVIADGISKGIGKVTESLKSAIGNSLKLAADFETISTSFRTLVGDAAKADSALQSIRTLGANTPFEFPELADAGRKLIAFGEDAGNVTEVLRRIGDVSAGVSAPIGEIAEIYGKARVQGRLFAEDINQLTGRGIPIIQELARQFGVADSEVKKLIESGKVGFPQLEQAFINLTSNGGKFSGQMDALSRTTAGVMSNLKDTINGALTDVGTGINSALRPLMADLSAQLAAMSPTIRQIGQDFGTWLQGIYQAQGGVTGITASLADAAQWVNVVFQYIKTGGQTAVAVFQAIGTTIGAAVSMGEQQIRLLMQAVSVGARGIKQAFLEIVYTVEKAVVESINKISNLVSEAAKKLATISNKVLDTEEGITPLANAFGRVANNRVAVGQPNDPIDMPNRPATDGPDGSLFGLIDSPKPPELPADLVVDYTGLGDQLNLTNATTAESFRVVKETAVDAFSSAGTAATEANQALSDAANGISWGDKIKESANKAAEETKRATAVQVASIQSANNSAIQSDIAKVNASTALAGQEAAAKVNSANLAAQGIEKAHERAFDQVSQMSQNTTTDLVSAWATGTGKISDIVNQWAQQMIRQFIQVSLWGNKSAGGSYAGLLGGLGGASSGGGGGSSTMGWVSAIGSIFGAFGGAYANGGRPPMGKVSIVGERGPELFVPDSAGRIIPNNAAASMMGGGAGMGGGGSQEAPIIINQTFSTGVTFADLAGVMDEMQDRAMEGVRAVIQRGGSYRKSVQS